MADELEEKKTGDAFKLIEERLSGQVNAGIDSAKKLIEEMFAEFSAKHPEKTESENKKNFMDKLHDFLFKA